MSALTIKIPDIGSDDAVDVIEISVKEGDQVEPEQTLLVLESAKASFDVPAEQSGTITKILTQVGQQVKTGDDIFVIEIATDDSTEKPNKTDTDINSTKPSGQSPSTEINVSNSDQTKAEPSKIAKPEKTADTALKNTTSNSHVNLTHQGTAYAGPAVRRLANQLGVDLHQVSGTGPKQRILKEDVKAYVKQRIKQPVQSDPGTAQSLNLPEIDFEKWGPVETKPLTKIQKLSAQNLTRAWQIIPHVTQFDQACIENLEAFRVSENKKLKPQGQKLTLLAFLIKACANALGTFPKFKSSLSLNGESLIYKDYCHIGFAADTEQGLVVPVVFNADQKSLIEIAKEIAELSEKARNKQLKPKQMQGGCFTISSLGGIGGTAFTPIVNWPEVAILGVSRSQTQLRLEAGECVEQLVLPLSLSYDHRVIDGADAARFTSHLSYLLADLRRLLL